MISILILTNLLILKKTSNATYKADANLHNTFSDTNSDLSCFKGSQWLTGDVINEYVDIINEQFNQTVFVFSTHFFASLIKRGVKNMRRWTKNVNLFEKEYVFFPIHEDNHWYFRYLEKRNNTINVLDPYVPLSHFNLPKQYQNDVNDAKEKEINDINLEHEKKIETILNYILKHHECPENTSFTKNIRMDIPKQTNEWSFSFGIHEIFSIEWGFQL